MHHRARMHLVHTLVTVLASTSCPTPARAPTVRVQEPDPVACWADDPKARDTWRTRNRPHRKARR